MHSHRYCSPMRSTEMKTGPSLFLWTNMQNHRYFYGPSATMAKPMEKRSDGRTFVHIPNTPHKSTSVH